MAFMRGLRSFKFAAATSIKILGLSLALGAGAGLFASALADDSHTPLEPIDCPGERPKGEQAACFLFHLPADWNKISGRSIETPVMHFAALGDEASKPPLLVLVGGPGQSVIYNERGLLKSLAPFRQNRDLILMDQRGTGPMATDLACKEAITKEGGTKIPELIACAKQAREQGYILEDYDTLSSAKDYKALRYALKISQWDIIATSYGARVGQKLLEIDEKGVNRILFNSPLFNQIKLIDWDPKALVDDVIERCNDDDVCRKSYPSLYWDFETLPFKTQQVQVEENPQKPRELAPFFYQERLKSFLSRHKAGEIPHDIANTVHSLDKAIALDEVWTMPPPLAQSMKNISLLMHFANFCREEVDRLKGQDIEEARQPLTLLFYRKACEGVKVKPLKAGWDKGKKSKAKILILNGSYDAIVDPQGPKEILPLYPNAKWITLPNAGHDVVSRNACARAIATDFLAGKPLQADCAKDKTLLFLERGPAVRTVN